MTKNSRLKIIPDLQGSYLKMVENSPGTRLFQNFYVRKGKRKIDATAGGRFSCALFVSFILNNFGLLRKSHTTVKSTLRDMQNSGWFEINLGTVPSSVPRGAVLVWEEKKDKRGIHQHIGFYIGKNQAISNSFQKKTPVCHHWTFGPRGSKSYRRVVKIFWHNNFT